MFNYLLSCPKCKTANTIVTETPTVNWTCINCQQANISSLSTNGVGGLIAQIITAVGGVVNGLTGK